MTKTDHLVMGTVNAPFRDVLSEDFLVVCLKDRRRALRYSSHLSVFFKEVTADLQLNFAKEHHVTRDELLKTCQHISEVSGEIYPLQVENHGC